MVVLKTKDKTKEIKLQKNRFFKKPKKIEIKFGTSAIINLNEGRLELIQINSIKKLLKKLLKKKSLNKQLNFVREKIWYFGKPNFFLQKKSKNARMGKGKGLLERKVLRLKKNFIIFEFSGLSIYKLNWIKNKINKKSNLRFVLYTIFIKNTRNWFKRNTQRYYYTKYLHI